MHADAGTAPLMQHLRTATQALHTQAESQALQRDMMRGCLSQELFIAYLEQLLLIHQPLEEALRLLVTRVPALQQVVQPCHYHASRLVDDLRYFGSDLHDLQPVPATAQFLTRLATYRTEASLAVLGVHYVLEGSKNGGRFQAAKVREMYALPAQAGTTYLDPYGMQQQALWGVYKEAMNGLSLTLEGRATILDGANATFLAFSAMCQGLMLAPIAAAYAEESVR